MIDLTLSMDKEALLERFRIWWIKGKYFSGQRREQLYRRIGQLLMDGYPLGFILTRMREACENRNTRASRKEAMVIEMLAARINEGMTLTEALSDFVPTSDRVILTAAESGDRLGQGLKDLADMNSNLNSMISALKKAVTMPLITVAVLLGVIVFISKNIMVQFEASVPLHLWPDASRSLRGFGESLVSDWWLWAIGFAAFLSLVRWSLPNFTYAPARRVLDIFPPYAPYRRFQAFSFMISLEAMVRAGIPISLSIRRIGEHAALYLETFLLDVEDNIKRGIPDGQALSTPLFDDDTNDDLFIMGDSNDINGVLSNISRNIITRMRSYMDALNFYINLGIMAGAAFVLAWVITAIQGMSGAIEMMAR